jgi:hypothetical protein
MAARVDKDFAMLVERIRKHLEAMAIRATGV